MGRKPDHRWHILRSPPGRGAGWLGHLAAYGGAVLSAVAMGVVLFALALILEGLKGNLEVASFIGMSGFMLVFSPWLSWAGHFPGGLVLQVLARRGWMGWGVVCVAGGVVGAGLGLMMDAAFLGIFGPCLALVQAAWLRRFTHLGRTSKVSGPPNERRDTEI